jgi:hypothetical protein
MIKYDLTDPDQIVEYATNHNCIVVGSPRSNGVTEVITSLHFGAEPYDDSPNNRLKVPFRFVFPAGMSLVSAVVEPSQSEKRATSPGICNRDATQLIAKTDWWPADEYLRKTIRRGHDCALVLIIPRPFGTKRDVKTIVVAGISGVGTESAVGALVRDFRDLTPLNEARHAIGVLQAFYQKPSRGTDYRQPQGYRWKYLEGGRRRLGQRGSLVD